MYLTYCSQPKVFISLNFVFGGNGFDDIEDADVKLNIQSVCQNQNVGRQCKFVSKVRIHDNLYLELCCSLPEYHITCMFFLNS